MPPSLDLFLFRRIGPRRNLVCAFPARTRGTLFSDSRRPSSHLAVTGMANFVLSPPRRAERGVLRFLFGI